MAVHISPLAPGDAWTVNAELNVGMKAAQIGYTESVLNRTFFTLDVKRQDVLYVLP